MALHRSTTSKPETALYELISPVYNLSTVLPAFVLSYPQVSIVIHRYAVGSHLGSHLYPSVNYRDYLPLVSHKLTKVFML